MVGGGGASGRIAPSVTRRALLPLSGEIAPLFRGITRSGDNELINRAVAPVANRVDCTRSRKGHPPPNSRSMPPVVEVATPQGRIAPRSHSAQALRPRGTSESDHPSAGHSSETSRECVRAELSGHLRIDRRELRGNRQGCHGNAEGRAPCRRDPRRGRARRAAHPRNPDSRQGRHPCDRVGFRRVARATRCNCVKGRRHQACPTTRSKGRSISGENPTTPRAVACRARQPQRRNLS